MFEKRYFIPSVSEVSFFYPSVDDQAFKTKALGSLIISLLNSCYHFTSKGKRVDSSMVVYRISLIL
jgi:hypothetical protein